MANTIEYIPVGKVNISTQGTEPKSQRSFRFKKEDLESGSGDYQEVIYQPVASVKIGFDDTGFNPKQMLQDAVSKIIVPVVDEHGGRISLGDLIQENIANAFGNDDKLLVPETFGMSNKKQFPAGTSKKVINEHLMRDREYIQSLQQQASDTSPLEAFNVGSSKTMAGFGAQIKEWLGDEGALESFESGEVPYSYLKRQYPLGTTSGEMLPYFAPINTAGSATLKLASSIPRIKRMMDVTKAGLPLAQSTLAAIENPIIRETAIGAGFGAIDPYDTALSGALHGFSGAYLGRKLGKNFEAAPRFLSDDQQATIQWAKQNGYDISPGRRTNAPSLQMKENAYRGNYNTADIIKEFDEKENSNTAKIILGIFGQNGDQLSAKNLKSISDDLGKQYNDVLSNSYADGNHLINGMANTQVKHADKIVDPIEMRKYEYFETKMLDSISKTGQVSGENFQSLYQQLNREISRAKETRKYDLADGLLDLKDNLVESFEKTMGTDKLDKFRLLNQKYAVHANVLDSLDQANDSVNFEKLEKKLGNFDLNRYKMGGASQDSPVFPLEQLVKYNNMKQRGASLGATDSISQEVREMGDFAIDRIPAYMRGLTPKVTSPMPFRSSATLGARLQDSRSPNDPNTYHPVDLGIQEFRDYTTVSPETRDWVRKFLGLDNLNQRP